MKALSLLTRLTAYDLASKLDAYDEEAKDRDLEILEAWCGEPTTRTLAKGGASRAYTRQPRKPSQKTPLSHQGGHTSE